MGSVRAAKAAVLVLMLATAVVWGRVGQSDGGGGIVSDQGAPAASNAPLAFTPWPPAVVERDALVQPFEESGAATLPDAFAPRTASATQAPVEGPVSTPQPATSTEVAQSVEQPPVKRQVAGSNPALGASAGEAQADERLASNQEAAGSRPAASPTPYVAPVQPTTFGAALEASSWPASTYGMVERIARCESGLRTDVTGAAGERGLMQVHPVNAGLVRQLGYTWEQMYQALPNLEVAYALYLAQGWGAWRGCL